VSTPTISAGVENGNQSPTSFKGASAATLAGAMTSRNAMRKDSKSETSVGPAALGANVTKWKQPTSSLEKSFVNLNARLCIMPYIGIALAK